MSTQHSLDFSIDVSHGHANEQSRKAHLKVVPHKSSLQQRVLALIETAPNGLSLYELSDALNKAPHSVSGRISELKIQGKIHEAGTRLNKLGNSCAVYRAKSEAVNAG